METKTTKTGELTIAEKVAERGKDVSYFAVICIGFGITGFLLWVVLSEFFSSGSPSSIFKRALKKVKANEQVRAVIGENITGYGDWSSRGRRRRITHQPYIVGDTNYVRVQFYISGSRRKATVQADMQEVSRGHWEFRFLFVELEGQCLCQSVNEHQL
jgi:import inner membrane translocase subunit TIM21